MKYSINIFNQNNNINDMKYLLKLLLIAISMPIGICFSLYSAYHNINFLVLIETINDNLFNFELLDHISDIFKPWYTTSIIFFLVGIILLFSSFLIKSPDTENISFLTAIRISIVIFLITQIILPLHLLLFGICICLLFLIFAFSMFMKSIISYPFYFFIVILEKFSTSTGFSISYGDFIGKQSYSTFLTLITFFVSVPYLLNLSLLLIKKFFTSINGSGLTSLMFWPIDYIFRINNIRYFIYIFLFFTSILTYSMNISTNDKVLMMTKESLLEFVLLDSVIYSIYNNLNNLRKKRKLNLFLKIISPFKYDLNFVANTIIIYNLKSKVLNARLSFNIDKNLKNKIKLDEFNDLNKMLTDISMEYMDINVLEKKIHEAIRLINLVEIKLQCN